MAIVVVGDNEMTSREAYADNHLGDRADLGLPGQQDALVRAVLATGKPVVLVLVNGRPLSIPDLVERVPAILEGWYLGQETGTAMAEVLFGDVNPEWQAARHRGARRRPAAHLLQPQAVGAARLPVRHDQPAIPVRLRSVVHDVRLLESARFSANAWDPGAKPPCRWM